MLFSFFWDRCVLIDPFVNVENLSRLTKLAYPVFDIQCGKQIQWSITNIEWKRGYCPFLKMDPSINNQYWTKKRLSSILENGSIDQYLILNEKEATVHSWKWIHRSITNIEQKRGYHPYLKMDPSINNQYWMKKKLSSILQNGSIYINNQFWIKLCCHPFLVNRSIYQ